MARRFNMVAFMVFAVAALLQSSAAQTTHVVGDSLGWVIPPGGPVAYTTWAARNTFIVGDILVFNFTKDSHDVAQVSKEAFDACNGSNTISVETNSPANFTLDKAGTHYYICTYSGHCGLGQRLEINVSSASAPAPQPNTPSPASAPTPTPNRSPVTYTVGDVAGWNVLPAGEAAYQTWASNKTFFVGDILVFNFANGSHDVAELTEQAYKSCDTNTTITLIRSPPARITLTKSGGHFFTCTFPRHCSLGQKLTINVTGTTTATPPSSTATPPSTTPTPSPSANPPSTTVSPPPSQSATPPSSTATPPSTTTTPSTPTTPSAPSPGSNTPTTPGNSATSLSVAGLSVTFLSVAVAFLY